MAKSAGTKKSAKASARPAAAKPVKRGNEGGGLSGDRLLALYRDMLLIRRFEEKAGQLYGMGLIGGFCHLYIGQEAVVVGMQSALGEDDYVITTYRDHGHMLAAGMDPKGVMAELTGRRSGYSKGKGGSMHMFSREKNFFGGHGIVGAPVPIAAGLALSQSYLGTGGITVGYFGDGAANQGQVHEALNMAALWKLPVIYVIENNKYGMGTAIERASAVHDLYRIGEPFGIPGRQVDGMDVLAVRAASVEAVAQVRAGKGPHILEMMTYRYRGHSMSDPAKYRTREEVTKVREERDCIDHLRKDLIARRLITEDGIKKIDAEVRARVNEAAEFAQNSPEPDPSELYTDVLAAA